MISDKESMSVGAFDKCAARIFCGNIAFTVRMWRRKLNMTILEQNVTFPGETTPSLNGFLVRPEGARPFPGVVVIHEAYGLNDNMRDIARRFANEGYAALSADLSAGRH